MFGVRKRSRETSTVVYRVPRSFRCEERRRYSSFDSRCFAEGVNFRPRPRPPFSFASRIVGGKESSSFIRT